MYTNSFVQQSITSQDVASDLRAIRRLLVAAAISPQFCVSLLVDPNGTVRRGFGGELFLLSEPTMNLLTSVRAANLQEFIYLLDEKLSNRLLGVENFKAYR